jgi:hypothetical protein
MVVRAGILSHLQDGFISKLPVKQPWQLQIDRMIWNAVINLAVHGPHVARPVMEELWTRIGECAKTPVLWSQMAIDMQPDIGSLAITYPSGLCPANGPSLNDSGVLDVQQSTFTSVQPDKETAIPGCKRYRDGADNTKSGDDESGEEFSEPNQRPTSKRVKLRVRSPEMSENEEEAGQDWPGSSSCSEGGNANGDENMMASGEDEVERDSGQQAGQKGDKEGTTGAGNVTSEDEIQSLTRENGDSCEGEDEDRPEFLPNGRKLRDRRELDARYNEHGASQTGKTRKMRKKKARLSHVVISESDSDDVRELTEAEAEHFFVKVRTYPESKAKKAFEEFQRRLRVVKTEDISTEKQTVLDPLSGLDPLSKVSRISRVNAGVAHT